MVRLVLAALALLGGAAVALTSGDPRGILILALGGVGGWAACKGLSTRGVPAESDYPRGTGSAPGEPETGAPSASTPDGERPALRGPAVESVPVAPIKVALPRPVGLVASMDSSVTAAAPDPSAAPAPVDAATAAPPPAPAAVPASELVAVGAARDPLTDAAPVGAVSGAPVEVHDAPSRDVPAGTAAADSPRVPAQAPDLEARADAPTSLPAEVRLQDLAERQRSSTADIRRSIRDVIERLEDEEPPAPRRRAKKGRR